MPGGLSAPSEDQLTIYCIVPRRLPDAVFESLRSHYRGEPSVEVVVERRGSERRGAQDRRAASSPSVAAPAPQERRRILSTTGRRAGERRAEVVSVRELPRPLPPEAEPYAAQLVLVARPTPARADLEDLDSARLVMRYQGGDESALGELYLRYFDRVYSYLRMALRDEHEAEDATQDVFTRVLSALPSYRRVGRPFRAWLFTIVRNIALDRLRRRHRLEFYDPSELPSGKAGQEDRPAFDWISDRHLLLLIERLPEAQRQVLILRYMLDLPIADIAGVMELEPNHVSVLHMRALRFLRERLASLRGESGGERAEMRRLGRPSPVIAARRRVYFAGAR